MANERDHDPSEHPHGPVPMEHTEGPEPHRTVPMDEDEIWPTGAVPRETFDVEDKEPSSPHP